MSRRKKFNIYRFDGDVGIGITSNTGREFYFDKEDFEKIRNYCWSEHILKSGYSVLEGWDGNQKMVVRMPWIIVGKNFDHINRNPLDNRKQNLREASQQENIFNRSIQKSNKSGVIGVWQRSDNLKWVSCLYKNRQKMYYSQFDNMLDAIKARLAAEYKYFGEFAPQRNLFKQFGIG